MHSVLIVVGAVFPPAANAGLHRVLGWIENLPQLGWSVTVLALPTDYWPGHVRDESLMARIPEGVDVVRVAPRVMQRFPTVLSDANSGNPKRQGRRWLSAAVDWVKNRVLFPDSRVLWVPPAVREGRHLAREGRVDVVLTTSPERSSHLVGMRTANALGVPWVADFRDPWETSWDPPPTRLHMGALRALGRRIGSRATLVTAVSESLASQLSAQFGIAPQKIAVIPNGLDENTISNTRPLPNGTFRIVHTGRFYGRRSPVPFLRAVRALIHDRPEVAQRLEICLFGSFDQQMRASLSPFSKEPWLHLVGEVSHRDALQAQREAGALLLMPGEDTHTVPGKLLEYLAARRPIVAVCRSDSDSARLLRQEGGGLQVDPEDEVGIRRAVEQVMAGVAPPPLDEARLMARFGRSTRAMEMSAGLKKALSKSRSIT